MYCILTALWYPIKLKIQYEVLFACPKLLTCMRTLVIRKHAYACPTYACVHLSYVCMRTLVLRMHAYACPTHACVHLSYACTCKTYPTYACVRLSYVCMCTLVLRMHTYTWPTYACVHLSNACMRRTCPNPDEECGFGTEKQANECTNYHNQDEQNYL